MTGDSTETFTKSDQILSSPIIYKFLYIKLPSQKGRQPWEVCIVYSIKGKEALGFDSNKKKKP